MDCRDWKFCPGECNTCDLFIDQVSGWRFVWLRVRRAVLRALLADPSLGRVRHLYSCGKPPASGTGDGRG